MLRTGWRDSLRGFAGRSGGDAVRPTPGCEIRDSKDMTLEEMVAWLLDPKASRNAVVIRLQTGDPGLYGALIEMTQPLTAAGVE